VTILFANVPTIPALLTLTSIVPSIEYPQILATWTTSISSNGDSILGFKLYIDDGEGGDYSKVFDGTSDAYFYVIKQDIKCGVVYNVKVTAFNSAGESLPTLQRLRVGIPSSVPLFLNMTSLVPSTSLTLAWQAPFDNGCLPLISYVLNKNGVDMVDVIGPNQLMFVDTHLASAGGLVGTIISYKLKTVNYAGSSQYSEIL